MPEQTAGMENVLSKRLNKVLQTRIENDTSTLEALKQLSTFYTENTLQARRNLRSQIEKRSLDINESFLDAFREVNESFDLVYRDVSEMQSSIQEMSERLHNATVQTKQLLDQTNRLQKESGVTDLQTKVLGRVLDKFQLSQEELVALHGSKIRKDADITMDIFRALEKLQRIHGNCKVLLQSGHQTLALDIMEQLTLHQESALERLYRWTQSHCRNVDREDLTEIITKAMEQLQDRPVLFKYVIDEYCVSRRSLLVGEFINALTRGGPSGNPAPIEMRAHDPQIYITDMLVWLHKAIPAEKQTLQLLVSLCAKNDISALLEDALTSISEGICHPLKIRVEKIISTPHDATILYSITNLLRYYKKMIGKVTCGGVLGDTLRQLQDKSETAFLTSLEGKVNDLLVRVETPPRDLTPTPAINTVLAMLRDILSTASMSEGRESDMTKIASTVVDPLLRAIHEQAARLPSVDMAVYLLNCTYAMYTCLSLYQFMEGRLERLRAQCEAQVDTLTSAQAGALVANLRLGAVYTILQQQEGNTTGGKVVPLSTIPGMEPGNLKNFLTKFNSAVSKPDSLLMPQIHLLASSQHKKSVQKRSFLVLLAIYKQLYEAVYNPVNLYENPENILTITHEKLAAMIN